MKYTLYHLFYYLVLILAVIVLAWGIKKLITKKIVEEKVEYNTSCFKEGSIVVMGENGVVRISFPCDSNVVLGIVTRCDSIGEITFKYVK